VGGVGGRGWVLRKSATVHGRAAHSAALLLEQLLLLELTLDAGGRRWVDHLGKVR
jgi:hypothetical protein